MILRKVVGDKMAAEMTGAHALPKTHDSQSAANLERVTDYAEEKEIVGDFGKVMHVSCCGDVRASKTEIAMGMLFHSGMMVGRSFLSTRFRVFFGIVL